MEEAIKNIILEYLEREYKNKDAVPSLLVSGIATEIYNHRWEVYRYVKEEYDLEDIDMVADQEGVQLTKEERESILHNYQNSEYQDIDTIRDLIYIHERRRKEEK